MCVILLRDASNWKRGSKSFRGGLWKAPKCKDLHPIKFIWTQRISQVVSSSVASELIKLFDTAIRTPPYDWFGLSLRYTVYSQSGLKISIELMFEFSQVSVPMIMSGLVE